MSVLKSVLLLRSVCFGCAGTIIFSVPIAKQVNAQQALPQVTIDAPSRPEIRRATPSRQASRSRAPARRAVAAQVPQPQIPAAPAGRGVSENPRGAVDGYVANRSLAGTKTNTPIIETPQSVSVIGADQLRDQKINTKFDEALRYSPGVFGGTFGADPRQDWYQIRGFPAQTVGTFLDGLQLFSTAFATWRLQPFSLDRIEILRGPSAVLYGGSSPSGIINAVSKFANAAPVRFIEAGVNNFGNAYTQFDFGGPVAQSPNQPGNLFYRIVGQASGGGSQVNFTNNDNYFLSPSFTYLPDIDTRLTVYAQASYNETRGQNFLPYIGSVTDAPFGRISTRLFASDPSVDAYRRSQQMIGWEFEKNLSESATFRQNARYAHINVLNSTLFGLGYATTPAAANLARGNFLVRNDASQGTLDNQFEYRFATGPVLHKTLVGVDLKHYGIDDFQAFGGATPINLVNPAYNPTARFSGPGYQDAFLTQAQAGLYVQDQMKFDRLTLVLSGRNDWVQTNNKNRIGPSQDRSDSQFSGRFGVIYNFDFGLAPYASYATSYNPVVGSNSATGRLLAPETGEQVEFGLKYEPLGPNRLRFGAAVFDLKRQNALTIDPTNALLVTQTGEVTSRGVELEAVANITPDFKLVASYTAFDFFVSKDLNPALVGTVPTNTPRQLASLWTDYTFREGPLSGFGIGGGIRYVGASFADRTNRFAVPSVVLGDLAVHYQWDKTWRAALNVINITDTVYVASCSSLTACFYGDRRRVTGSLSYQW